MNLEEIQKSSVILSDKVLFMDMFCSLFTMLEKDRTTKSIFSRYTSAHNRTSFEGQTENVPNLILWVE